MLYFFYCRDLPGMGELRKQTTEAHWRFMDAYESGFVARGPTQTDDGSATTGSMHIVDLPDAAAARHFAYDEPRHRAGVHGEVIVSRWRNDSGRTIWDYPRDLGNDQRFLLIAPAAEGRSAQAEALLPARRQYFADTGFEDQVIVQGALLTDDGRHWAGTAMMVQGPGRAWLEAIWRDDPLVKEGLYRSTEMHRWMFGGRR